MKYNNKIRIMLGGLLLITPLGIGLGNFVLALIGLLIYFLALLSLIKE